MPRIFPMTAPTAAPAAEPPSSVAVSIAFPFMSAIVIPLPLLLTDTHQEIF